MNELSIRFQQYIPFFVKLVVVLLTLFVFTKLFGPIPFSIKAINSGVSDVFSITGEGRATVKPDIAVVTLGVNVQASTVKIVQDQLNQRINKITSELKKLGIDEKDIKTENYNIYPEYDSVSISSQPVKSISAVEQPIVNLEESKYIRGYSATTNLSIKVHDTEKVNQVIDIGTQNGANQIGGIGFDVDDRTSAENEARIKAVKDARKKAEAAAKVAGFRLGKIVNYYESLSPYSQQYSGVAAMDINETAPTQIQPGSMEVVISATLNYEIK